MNQATMQQLETETFTPSISSSAMLVDLSIGIWEGRKKDKAASEKVVREAYATRGAATVNKQLLGNCAELGGLKQLAAQVRQWNINSTLPWATRGARLLTNAQFFDYKKEVTAFKQQFDRLVEEFLTAYSWEVSQAQARLGNLFNRDDYPPEHELRHKFRFSTVFMPLPEAGDFRLDTQNEAMRQVKEQLSEQYAEFYQTKIKDAMDDLWKRLLEPLQNMSEKLDYSNGEKPTLFRDTLVSNIEDIAKLLNTCNVTQDPNMERVRKDLINTLRGVTPAGLREDPHLRLETKRNVDNIIKTLPSLGW